MPRSSVTQRRNAEAPANAGLLAGMSWTLVRIRAGKVTDRTGICRAVRRPERVRTRPAFSAIHRSGRCGRVGWRSGGPVLSVGATMAAAFASETIGGVPPPVLIVDGQADSRRRGGAV